MQRVTVGGPGVEVCRSAPIMSHLLFVDDSFLFLELKRLRRWS